MLRNHEDAFTGLEAAIVLIAFVVVAAVFSYVVLGAGFFTTQKAQETVYKGVEQATANLQMIGNVYAFNSTPATITGEKTIDEIRITLALAPGAPSVDLSKMRIVFSTPATIPVVLNYTATAANTASFNTTLTGGSSTVSSMSAGDQVQVDFFVVQVSKSTTMNFELRPSVGAALPFTKIAPASIDKTNILY